jgi:hypothetical protein
MGTCHHADQLMRLDVPAGEEHMQRAAQWLLDHCIVKVRRRSPQIDGVVVAHHMFSTEDRAAEFKSAAELHPEWDPKSACFRHLPIIQNGLAIQMLVALGHAEDQRVLAACENLVALERNFGGFCDTNVRKGLETTPPQAGVDA